jgi:hypothetical protein
VPIPWQDSCRVFHVLPNCLLSTPITAYGPLPSLYWTTVDLSLVTLWLCQDIRTKLHLPVTAIIHQVYRFYKAVFGMQEKTIGTIVFLREIFFKRCNRTHSISRSFIHLTTSPFDVTYYTISLVNFIKFWCNFLDRFVSVRKKFDIISDSGFDTANNCFQSLLRKTRQIGKGAVQHHEAISRHQF